jgi:class 3 adenylate cyclase
MAEERAQRRLAAILAADVVGYSRLMEQDEAGTLAALSERRKTNSNRCSAKYRGSRRSAHGRRHVGRVRERPLMRSNARSIFRKR